jgi:hypothetical protein
MAAPAGQWKVKYSTAKDLDRARRNLYDGKVTLLASRRWMVLVNAKGDSVIGRYVRDEDCFTSGSVIHFPSHEVFIGECVISPKVRNPSADLPLDDSVRAASRALGLDLAPGQKFKAEVKNKFRSTVHPLGKSNHFLMVVSFGQSKFKLDVLSVGLALESCLGGSPDDMLVVQLSDRVFRFSVASKAVGFLVNSLRVFSSAEFKCFFHLWGNGGPSWQREFKFWQSECQQEWILVSPNKKRTDAALHALSKKPTNPSIKPLGSRTPARKKLSFATFQAYPACAGYEFPASRQQVLDAVEAGYDCPQIRRKAGVIFSPAIIQTDVSIQFGSTETRRENELSDVSPILADSDLGQEISPRVFHSVTSEINASVDVVQPDEDDPFGLNELIDDMSYRVWKCGRCLSMRHLTANCTNDVRCRSCFRYGHMRKDCLGEKTKRFGYQNGL